MNKSQRLQVKLKYFYRDLSASVVVFLISLPFSMGVAIASGVPAIYGILAGIVGGLVVAPLAGAPFMITGPAAGLVVIVWDIVNKHGLEFLGPIVFFAGLLQIVGGLLAYGKWFKAIVPAVTYGMLAGIGILIIASQLYVLFGLPTASNGLDSLAGLPHLLIKVLTDLTPLQQSSGMIGLSAIIIIFIWSKIPTLNLVPASLMAVVIGSFLASIVAPEISKIEFSLKTLTALNYLSLEGFKYVLSSKSALADVLILGLVASTQGMLTALAVDQLRNKKSNYDRELLAQGAGNMTCGIFGLMPITGVPVRSVANVKSQAKTRMSAIFQGLWLILLCLLFPSLLEKIPVTVLAGLLIFVGLQIVSKENFLKVKAHGQYAILIYLATAIGVIFVNVLTGVLIGFGLSIARLVYQLTHFSVRVEKFSEGQDVHLYLQGAATFVSLPILAESLDKLDHNIQLTVHIKELKYIDQSCLDALAHWEELSEEQGGTLVIKWADLFDKLGKHDKLKNEQMQG